VVSIFVSSIYNGVGIIEEGSVIIFEVSNCKVPALGSTTLDTRGNINHLKDPHYHVIYVHNAVEGKCTRNDIDNDAFNS
jgi:hypothetical protein